MSRDSGRVELGAKWPSDKPLGVIFAIVIATVSTGAFMYFQSKRSWPFVERLYMRTYLTAGLARMGR